MSPPPPPTFSVNSSQNIAEDFYNAFSIRWSSVANLRPIWYISLTVDQISFFIGAIGGVSMGYMLNQYEAPNIDNIDYINNQRDEGPGFFWNLVQHTFSSPLNILQRFFTAGCVYILIGFATNRLMRRARPFICGALTGLYFSYGSSFTTMVKATAGFATFAMVMEGLLYMAVSL